MYKLICVSNRTLCNDLTERIKKIASCGIPVILREKDLCEDEYFSLLKQVGTENIIAHTYADAAMAAGIKKIHLPLHLLERTDVSGFERVGSSVHSLEQALRAYECGADYLTAGHIFATDCKKGLPPRGTGLIREICAAVPLPVYAIGGISPDNANTAIDAGAAGVCAMSGFMRCADIKKYISLYAGACSE